MNNSLFQGLRLKWDNLSARERRMFAAMGTVFGAMVLLLPLVMMGAANSEIEGENARLTELLDALGQKSAELSFAAEERKQAAARYKNKTPPLGSFLEAEAKKQGLTIREMADQPEKTVGAYLRRSVRVTLPTVGLTPIINLLASIVASPHPVAIDLIQLDHVRGGDEYNVKLGVLTYDKQAAPVASATPKKAAEE